MEKEYKYEFKKKQLLVEYLDDEILEVGANDVVEVKVLNKGNDTSVYDIGDTLLVRKGYVEDIKSPHFKKTEKIIFDEDKVLCKYHL
jgi:hypothetical protein